MAVQTINRFILERRTAGSSLGSCACLIQMKSARSQHTTCGHRESHCPPPLAGEECTFK